MTMISDMEKMRDKIIDLETNLAWVEADFVLVMEYFRLDSEFLRDLRNGKLNSEGGL